MIKLRKIVYQVHMDKLDARGNIVDELTVQQPITLYPHQLDELPAQVAAVVAQAVAQDDQAAIADGNGTAPNRATRRAAARKKPTAAN